jgi:hypothetical protein
VGFPHRNPREHCYDFKNIFSKNVGKKIGVFWIKQPLRFAKKALVFEKNAIFSPWQTSQNFLS